MEVELYMKSGKKSKFKAAPQHKLIFIEWVDSSRHGGAWEHYTKDQFNKDTSLYCHSVGWLVGETKTQITVAQTISIDDHPERDQMLYLITIPKCAIVSRRELKL